MDKIFVRRHGDRWAILEDPEGTPSSEYDTRELAELAARGEAGGREVVVDEEPHGEGLGGGAVGDEDRRPLNRDAGIDQRTSGAGSGDETPREPQAGL